MQGSSPCEQLRSGPGAEKSCRNVPNSAHRADSMCLGHQNFFGKNVMFQNRHWNVVIMRKVRAPLDFLMLLNV